MPLEPHQQAGVLRRRAFGLRRVAAAIDRCRFDELEQLTGVATWTGPRPAALAGGVHTSRVRLDEVVVELRWSARRMDDQAASLELLIGG